MILAKRGDTGTAVRLIQKLLKIKVDGQFGQLTFEAVEEFQRANGLVPDGIVGAKTWAKMIGMLLHPTTKRRITEIIVHCTATPEGRDVSVDEIRRWHKQQGWSDIGYHYVVARNGRVEPGRPIDIAGAHCVGHNTHSVGVVYVGGLAADGRTPKDTRTTMQRNELRRLLVALKMIYPEAKIYGHRDFAAKACPSFDAKKEYADI